MELTTAIICDCLRLDVESFTFLNLQWDGREVSLRRLYQNCQPHRQKELPSFEKILKQAESVLRQCRELGLLGLHPASPNYPGSYREIHKPPLFLTYRGDPQLLSKSSLSVVGSREPLVWVERWMESEFMPYVRDRRSLIVSGGAIGIDQMAHRAALRAGGQTLAILPSGLNVLYPKNMKSFLGYLDRGDMGFLSEYPPQMPMKTFHFHRRNRLISAHSKDLFVVQAHKKSGTMITAQYGVDQGKNLVVLASDPMEPRTLGNLQLLFDGAQMIRWGSDLPFC